MNVGKNNICLYSRSLTQIPRDKSCDPFPSAFFLNVVTTYLRFLQHYNGIPTRRDKAEYQYSLEPTPVSAAKEEGLCES